MKNILNNRFFSIEFFDEEGIYKVAEILEGDYEEILYEQSVGNFFVGQADSGRLYFFCETEEPEKEVPFNYIKILAKAIK